MKEKVIVTLDFNLLDELNGMEIDAVIQWCEAIKIKYPNYDKLFLSTHWGEEYSSLLLVGKRDINERELETRAKKKEIYRKKQEIQEKAEYKRLKEKYE